MAGQPQIILRNARETDIPFLFRLFERSIRQTCVNAYSPGQINAWVNGGKNPEKWLQRIVNDYFVLVEFNQKLAGFSSLRKDGYLDLMFVDPDFQRTGVASMLLDNILKKARQAGYESVVTDASHTAKPFFLHHGFSVEKINHLELSGVAITNFRMKKVI